MSIVFKSNLLSIKNCQLIKLKKNILFTIILMNFINSQDAVVFRYNSDPACIESVTDVQLSNLSIEQRTDPIEQIARGSEGWGFSKRYTTLFDNDSSLIESSSELIITFSGPHEISGEIWFQTYEPDGGLLSWIDSSRATGISFYILDSIANLNFKFRNEFYTISDSINKIELNKWTLINWFCRASQDSIQLGILNNGVLTKFSSSPITVPPIFSSYISKVKLGDVSGIQKFKGELHAANIKNYFLDSEYAIAAPSFDGSSYFGIPNYLDNHLGIYIDNIDERITSSPTPIDVKAFVPYQNDDYVPQGLTNSFEDKSYGMLDGYLYVSMYNKTIFGASYLKNSIIVELDPQNGYYVRRCFMLNGSQASGHNGGIAFYNNCIYVATNFKVGKYIIPDYEPGGEKYQTLTLTSENTFSVSSKASFMTYYRDSIWVGDYRESQNQIEPYLYGYPLDSIGNISSFENPTKYRIPYQTQGVAWIERNNIDYLFINTTNGGNNYSTLYRTKKNNLKLENISDMESQYSLPAQVEDLSFDQYGNLITVSESGSKYYQIGAGWEMFFPFIFSVDKDTIFSNESILTINLKDNFRPNSFKLLQNYPNPFNGITIIPFELTQPSSASQNINIYNIKGEIVKNYQISNYSIGRHYIKWDATDNQNRSLPSGQYFISINLPKNNSITNKTIYIK